jgi:hypothetical protein
MGFTVGTQTPNMDLICACNARRTAPVGLMILDLAKFLIPSVLATPAMLFTLAGHGTQQKTFDYQQSSFVSRALQARISLKQCNGEKSNTRHSQRIQLV